MSNALPVPAPRHLTALPPADPDHHLWRNGRLWWIAMTVESAAGERWRVRRSLKTADIEEARRRRDEDEHEPHDHDQGDQQVEDEAEGADHPPGHGRLPPRRAPGLGPTIRRGEFPAPRARRGDGPPHAATLFPPSRRPPCVA